jgi:hypothetical protein
VVLVSYNMACNVFVVTRPLQADHDARDDERAAWER